MQKLRKRAALAAALMPLISCVPSFAGFVVNSHTVSASGAGFTETAPFQVFSTTDNVTKLAGAATFTASGGSATLTFTADGSLTASAGDDLRVSYDFTIDLSGGTATPTVNGSFTTPAPIPFLPPITLTGSSAGSPVGPGPLSHEYQGTFDSGPLPIDINGTFTVDLAVDWTGTTAGDTLSVTIPQHSIDLQVVPVPEPSCALLGFAAVPLVLRRRR